MTLYQQYPTDRITEGPHDVEPSDIDAEMFIQDAVIGDGWLHPYSSNYTFVVELTYERRSGYGLYKPKKGEMPLWDFPTGTLYRRECAMYELARALNWDLVPPTLVREGEVGIGSIQLFVPSASDMNYFSMRDSNRDELLRLAVLDVIANNADRKGGHCLADRAGHLWGVDHGLTFHAEHKLRTVIWDFAGIDIPTGLVGDLHHLLEKMSGEDLKETDRLLDFLSESEADSLLGRVERLIERPVMPKPFSRRDVPWPWF